MSIWVWRHVQIFTFTRTHTEIRGPSKSFIKHNVNVRVYMLKSDFQSMDHSLSPLMVPVQYLHKVVLLDCMMHICHNVHTNALVKLSIIWPSIICVAWDMPASTFPLGVPLHPLSTPPVLSPLHCQAPLTPVPAPKQSEGSRKPWPQWFHWMLILITAGRRHWHFSWSRRNYPYSCSVCVLCVNIVIVGYSA